jgi:hypothetical protein
VVTSQSWVVSEKVHLCGHRDAAVKRLKSLTPPATIGGTIYGHPTGIADCMSSGARRGCKPPDRNRLFCRCLLAATIAVTTFYTYLQVTRSSATCCLLPRGRPHWAKKASRRRGPSSPPVYWHLQQPFRPSHSRRWVWTGVVDERFGQIADALEQEEPTCLRNPCVHHPKEQPRRNVRQHEWRSPWCACRSRWAPCPSRRTHAGPARSAGSVSSTPRSDTAKHRRSRENRAGGRPADPLSRVKSEGRIGRCGGSVDTLR